MGKLLPYGQLPITSFLGESFFIVLSAEEQYMVVFPDTTDMHKKLIIKFVDRLLTPINLEGKFLSL